MSSFQCCFDDAAYQQFTIPKPITNYLMNNASSIQLQKLYKTCKYFYAKFRVAIFEDMCISDNAAHEHVNANDWESAKNRFWAIGEFGIYGNVNFQRIFNKIARIDVDLLSLDGLNGKLTYNEFKLLTGVGTIKDFELYLHIYYPNNKRVPAEDIVDLLPHTNDITLYDSTVTSKTMKNLALIERPKKFVAFRMFGIQSMLNSDEVVEFVMKKINPDSVFILDYDNDDLRLAFGIEIYTKILPHLSQETLTHFLHFYGIQYPQQ